jgi:hypothetical protein
LTAAADRGCAGRNVESNEEATPAVLSSTSHRLKRDRRLRGDEWADLDRVVPRTGIEPVRTVKSCGFSYPPRLWPPHTATRRMFGVWSAPSPWRAADAARVRCPPSALYTFCLDRGSLARRCLAVYAAGGSPTLTGSIPHVSARALKLLSSPLRLPISPSRPKRMVARDARLSCASAALERDRSTG